jgi:hypothetical protein
MTAWLTNLAGSHHHRQPTASSGTRCLSSRCNPVPCPNRCIDSWPPEVRYQAVRRVSAQDGSVLAPGDSVIDRGGRIQLLHTVEVDPYFTPIYDVITVSRFEGPRYMFW